MINAPDPNARSTDKYCSDLVYRAAADKAHAAAMQFSTTLQLLRKSCDFIAEDIDWQSNRLADAVTAEVVDY